jgi:predicted hydrocarbon binding protein
MHGIVLKGLKDFVIETYDRETWRTLMEEAGVGYRLYVPVEEYPDEEVFALVETAVELTGIDAPDLLETFGRFVVPALVETYGVHVADEWSAIDLVANVETYIHESLRRMPGSKYTPPELSARRVDETTVLVRYESDRGLCDLAEGLLYGIADHYGAELAVEERRCMHEGAEDCELLVRDVGAA